VAGAAGSADPGAVVAADTTMDAKPTSKVVPEIGNVPMKNAETPTSPGETNATSVRLADRKEPEAAAVEVSGAAAVVATVAVLAAAAEVVSGAVAVVTVVATAAIVAAASAVAVVAPCAGAAETDPDPTKLHSPSKKHRIIFLLH